MNSQSQDTIEIQEETLREPFAQIPLFILANPTISPQGKVVYGLLLSYAWQKGSCFPGQERLADDMGRDVTNIRTYLKELKEKELVSYEKRGFAKTNLYIIEKVPQHVIDSYNKRGQQSLTKAKKERQNEPQQATGDVTSSVTVASGKQKKRTKANGQPLRFLPEHYQSLKYLTDKVIETHPLMTTLTNEEGSNLTAIKKTFDFFHLVKKQKFGFQEYKNLVDAAFYMDWMREACTNAIFVFHRKEQIYNDGVKKIKQNTTMEVSI